MSSRSYAGREFMNGDNNVMGRLIVGLIEADCATAGLIEVDSIAVPSAT